MDTVEVFQFQNGRLLQSHRLGDTRPFPDRPRPERLFVVPLQAEEQASELLLRVQSSSLVRISLQLLPVAEFNRQKLQGHAAWAMTYGALLVLVLLHAAAFWLNRRSQHLKLLGLMLLQQRHHQAVLLSFADDALHRARLEGGNRSMCYRLPRSQGQSSKANGKPIA